MTKAMLSKYFNGVTLPIYYIAGPQGMVAAMRKTLSESGVNDDNIRTEEFTGY
jgi:ferredoxin-NADP reductase